MGMFIPDPIKEHLLGGEGIRPLLPTIHQKTQTLKAEGSPPVSQSRCLLPPA